MTADDQPKWVLPADIPLKGLKARDLEECVFWLLDAMGARDLEWRTGGAGGGAADGGRDLEALFYLPSPDSEMEPQRWWIECKGRKDTVEPEAVKTAVVNAQGAGDLACLVIVTNSTFSNPTRDWVKKWQADHPRPKVKLWDRDSLERLLSRQPGVVLRLFSEGLSPNGQLEAVRERFWNKIEYTPIKVLKDLWVARSTLSIGALERVALLANEFAHGSVTERPWAAEAESQVLPTMQIGLLNLSYIAHRTIRAGVETQPIISTLAHLILATLVGVEPDILASHVLKLLRSEDGEPLPQEICENLLLPILGQMADEMREVCSADCERVSVSNARTFTAAGADSVETYWQRFDREGAQPKDESNEYLMFENMTAPCIVGFAVDEERHCPLFALKPEIGNVAEFFATVKRVSAFRRAQARAAKP